MKLINLKSLANCLSLILFMVFSSGTIAETVTNAAEPTTVDDSYLIGPGDRLSISVWKEEGMQMEVLVKPDGGITFPLAGEINANGLTTEQLKQALASKLKRYIPNPIVTVSVLQTLSNKVYVVGKVQRPGEFIASGYMDILQALTLAGGLTPYADGDEIKVIRRTGEGTKVFDFDYDEVISGERLDMNILLKAGDTVVVP